MNPAKKICSTIVALVLVFCAMPFSQAQAANDPETLFYVEDLGRHYCRNYYHNLPRCDSQSVNKCHFEQ